MQVMDPAARYRHELRLAGVGNCPPKPIWRRRTDRKEIDWDGFAAQGGYTRITGSALPLIGQHYAGRRTLLIPEPPVNSSISRPAVPPACSMKLSGTEPTALYEIWSRACHDLRLAVEAGRQPSGGKFRLQAVRSSVTVATSNSSWPRSRYCGRCSRMTAARTSVNGRCGRCNR